jgi:hypothetical protein
MRLPAFGNVDGGECDQRGEKMVSDGDGMGDAIASPGKFLILK